MPTATGEHSNRVEGRASNPTPDDIARRAYHLYEARRGAGGTARDDWFQAERELREGRSRRVGDGISDEPGPDAA